MEDIPVLSAIFRYSIEWKLRPHDWPHFADRQKYQREGDALFPFRNRRSLFPVTLAFCAALGAFGAGSSSASAQALFLSVTAPDISAAAAQAEPVLPQAVRKRLVRLDKNVLTRHVAPAGADLVTDRAARASKLDGVLTLNLFPDVTPTFRRTKVTAQDDGGYIWEGIVPNQGVSEALLLVNKGQIAGQVQLEHRIFRIDPVVGDVYRITEIDQSKFPPEGKPLLPPSAGQTQAPAPEPNLNPDATTRAAKVTVRVLVAYTANAMTEAGGLAAMKSIINQGVALANQAYGRGNIGINLVLAGTMKVNYNEGSDFSVDLNDVTSGSVLANVRTKRATVKADLVTLMRTSNSGLCGLGWLPGSGVAPAPSAATAGNGFQVVAQNCVVGNYSWHHEMGHNMGVQHDRFTYNEQTGQTPSNAYYDFGYANIPAQLRTVMSYNDPCAAQSVFCTRINWFSSGTIKATGNVVIGKPKGTAGAADNSTRLRQNRVGVSQYEQ